MTSSSDLDAGHKSLYQWYTIVDKREENKCEQGDIIFKCPVYIPKLDETHLAKKRGRIELECSKVNYNIIILTQSCDIRWKKVKHLIVCPFFPLSMIITGLKSSDKDLDENKMKEAIRKGHIPAYFMLNAFQEGNLSEEQVVNFKQIFTLKRSFIDLALSKQTCKIRLLPPYRESLAQSFGRFFMRVGYPVDIPSFPREI
ncbi:MAG: hypothetical protein ACTSRU_10015 [Candidatus Hodarchaeales archaeon]